MSRRKLFDVIIQRHSKGRPIEPVCFVADLNSAEARLLRIPRETWGRVLVYTLDGQELLDLDFRAQDLKKTY